MAKFELDENKIYKAMSLALKVWAVKMLDLAKEKVPRDTKRLPKSLNFKWAFYAKPKRNVRKNNKNYYRQAVQINWEWYSWVTGNLRKAISIEKVTLLKYKVWVIRWPVEKYAFTQEYWDPSRNIEKRSFLYEPFKENFDDIIKQINLSFIEILWKLK